MGKNASRFGQKKEGRPFLDTKIQKDRENLVQSAQERRRKILIALSPGSNPALHLTLMHRIRE
jgi:hypothetical protein